MAGGQETPRKPPEPPAQAAAAPGGPEDPQEAALTLGTRKPNSSLECHHACLQRPLPASPPHTSPPPPDHRQASGCPGTRRPPETTLLPPPGWQGPAGRRLREEDKLRKGARGLRSVAVHVHVRAEDRGPRDHRAPALGTTCGQTLPVPGRLPAAFSRQRGPRVGARAFDGQERPRVQHQGTGLRRPDRSPRPASPNRTPRP